ncbi:exopolysaccharide biosynthesis protein [Pleurocapsa sp. PCC 7319]|uniref:exopolysaccharide biosynthesis protein n=1 Tax=Pleurocapsa sp. PCC 7319 TaxID=118161 RepID=UPI000346CA1C|nr:exopolysaccharide biosynthesis protein [Pleurocapsa sp. PCC 7319]
MAKLSIELNRYFFEESRGQKVTLADILTLAGERVFGFLFVILALPSALPIPAPGYSVPFGVAMFFLAIQLIIGRDRPWLPAKIMNGSMPLEKVQGVVKKGIPWLQRIEALTQPRFSSICTSLPGRVVLGSAIALMSISMMIVIPGTNTLPAIGIFVTGFGLVEDDGAISLLGLIICALGAAVSTSILIAVVWGGSNLIDVIKEQLAR